MIRLIVAAALCLASTALAACGGDHVASPGTVAPAPAPPPAASPAVERAAAAYALVRGRAVGVLPLLPEPIADRVERAITLADAALALARSSPDDRVTALSRLAAAVASIAAALAAR